MAITTQAKRLKAALREAGVKEFGKAPSVRTEKNYIGTSPVTGRREYEYGRAVCVVSVKAVNDQQKEQIRQILGGYVEITEVGPCVLIEH